MSEFGYTKTLSYTMMTRSQTRIAQLEARIAHPTATIMKEQIDEMKRCAQGSRFEVEAWGWRYWRFLEDTPYTLGEINLAGWNSYEEMVKGKKAFRSIGQQPWNKKQDNE